MKIDTLTTIVIVMELYGAPESEKKESEVKEKETTKEILGAQLYIESDVKHSSFGTSLPDSKTNPSK